MQQQDQISKPELIWDAKAILGEGPVWVDRDNALYWVDIKGCTIHRLDWPSRQMKSWSVPCQIGALQPVKEGGFIGAFKDGIYAVTLDPGAPYATRKFICDPDEKFPDNRFNDGKIGPDGAFWTGTMDDAETDNTGRLFRINAMDLAAEIDRGYVITNGPGFSPDGKTLYHTDTLERQIYAFDLDVGSDTPARNRRKFISIPPARGYPDGMCVDAEGCIWICHFSGACIVRYNPVGEELFILDMPVSNITSCIFGGEDLSTLFVTTAAKGLSNEQLAKEPSAGGLFAIQTPFKGIATRYFETIR
jgi:D-xylonolactonase